MEQTRLEAHEVGFLLLLKSHRLLTRVLHRHVKDALTASYSLDWQKRIYSCFGRGTKDSVKKRLETGQEIKDIFILCKVICRYLRSVFTVSTTKTGHVMEDHKHRVSQLVAAGRRKHTPLDLPQRTPFN